MKPHAFTVVRLVLASFALLAACTPGMSPQNVPMTGTPSPTQGNDVTALPAERIKIRWFIGVGTGRSPQAVNTAREFVTKFNEANGKIELELEVVTSSTHDAIDRLMGEIEAGTPPDIVAPADKGWAGEQLSGYILPLDAASAGYDLSDADVKSLNAWRVDGELIGLPVGAYPSTIYYDRSLFDAARLPYPPHKFGEPYADGDPWTIDKMEAIAMQLTLDSKGRNAGSPNYDPALVVQWGFHWQWDSTRSMAVMFGAGSVADNRGRAVIPQQWRDAFRWYHDGMWNKRFIPTGVEVYQMQGNPFGSGKVAMVHTFMWYSPNLVDKSNWDLAAVPAYRGTITTRMEQDGIIILNTSQHPSQAVDAAYAIAHAPELLLAWEMIPTYKGMQSQFLEALSAKHPGVDWQVMLDSVGYADTTYESTMPNYRQSYDRLLAFRDMLGSRADISLDSEIGKLEADLQKLFEEVPRSIP